ncbi:hypothetical protein Vretimale_13362 [Volvox reticuliferus]|uniref:RAP domain-containing protein n=1 Tax=Volvox reticuliferus TaxID=1737510 RepID=A0A8J4FR56_9CHLO|nr:hypothetical protein Vretifemale_13997 [Volvox reticuliferus]GIM09533.1 hypothetical protein Vretimale_13362 [Volvox reticuliferus]
MLTWTFCNIHPLDATWVKKGKAFLQGKTRSAIVSCKNSENNATTYSLSDKGSVTPNRTHKPKAARLKKQRPSKSADPASHASFKRKPDAPATAKEIHVTSTTAQPIPPARQRHSEGGLEHHASSTAAGSTAATPEPKALSDRQLLVAARLADLDPDDLVNALASSRYTPSITHVPSGALLRASHHHVDTPTEGAIHITPALLLATCKELRRRLLLDRNFRPTHIVRIIELLATCCGDREEGREAAAVAGDLLQRSRGCSQGLQSAQRSTEQIELARLLPRLIPALVSLEYADKKAWEVIFRVMHSNMDGYTGTEVAALVPALVELDSVIASDGSSSSSCTGFGSQQLQRPAMNLRLQVLARDGGATGDATAALLLWLVGSSLRQVEVDQVVALTRRAMLQGDLSPRGHCHLLRATSLLCDRLVESATEAMDLLQRHESNLMPLLGQRLADQAAAGRLRPHEFTDAAQSFTQIRFMQPSFMAELAASTARGIREGELKLRDITVALYACAYFGCQEAATGDLFAAAAASLERRLEADDFSTLILARLAWSYAVAGGCRLLPQRRADRDVVERFLQKLVAALQSRVGMKGTRPPPEVSGLLRFAVQIWSATHPSLAQPALLAAVALKQQQKQHRQREGQLSAAAASLVDRGARSDESDSTAGAGAVARAIGNVSRRSNDNSSGGDDGGGNGHQGSSTDADNSSSSSSSSSNSGFPDSKSEKDRSVATATASSMEEPTHISKLQKDVFRHLEALGYEPLMEERVGFWTVDILFSVRGHRVAVEVDGPTHFTTSRPHRPLGPSLVRDTSLRRLGLVVVTLSFEDYELLPHARRGGYLRGRVELAVKEAETEALGRSRSYVRQR